MKYVPSMWRWLPFCSLALICVFTLTAGIGCRGPKGSVVSTPNRHTVRANQLLIRSDLELDNSHPLVQELTMLGGQIRRRLRLPGQEQDVSVYLFSDETSYRGFLDHHFPTLPRRRAYFVGSPEELAVYTYWGSRVQEDLRHEYTHGLLHASLKTVPLWLDEGLAEYFEVPGETPGEPNSEYVHRLAASLSDGWRPNLHQLESITDFSRLTYFDYQHAWAWVHFMLNSGDETRAVLLGYLGDLRTDENPLPLSQRLEEKIPDLNLKLVRYLTALHESEFTRGDRPVSAAAKDSPPEPTFRPLGTVRTAGRVVRDFGQIPRDELTVPITVPPDIPEIVLTAGEDGEPRAVPGRLLYTQFHRTGWQEGIDLFLAGRFPMDSEAEIRRHARETASKDDPFLQRSRVEGLIDCQRSLETLIARRGTDQVRKQVLEFRREQAAVLDRSGILLTN